MKILNALGCNYYLKHCFQLSHIPLLTLSDLWSESMWRWISATAVVFTEVHPDFMHLNGTYQSLFSFSQQFLLLAWVESYFRRFNYQVTMIYFSVIIFHCQLQIIWGAFLIYFCNYNPIPPRDSEIVEYIHNHRNVKPQKSFEIFFLLSAEVIFLQVLCHSKHI